MIANCQRAAALVACLLLAPLSAQAAPVKYTCQILDQRFDQAYGWALNEAGKVAGFDAGAARWSRTGKRADLAGAIPNEGSEAFGINGAGRVVGYSGLVGFPELATVWDGKLQTTLPPLPGGAAAVAFAVNDAGLIAGAGTCDGAEFWPSVNEMPIDLNTVTAPCTGERKAFIAERLVWAAGINDKGMILVEIQDFQHQRRWNPRTAVLRPVR